mmetsp:Transcript_25530/g.55499  ORF Transcript_25530/g.55499 Transcript_25530/m.55499 type:complete len:277 (+) Transcript_25530:168-998(+)
MGRPRHLPQPRPRMVQFLGKCPRSPTLWRQGPGRCWRRRSARPWGWPWAWPWGWSWDCHPRHCGSSRWRLRPRSRIPRVGRFEVQRWAACDSPVRACWRSCLRHEAASPGFAVAAALVAALAALAPARDPGLLRPAHFCRLAARASPLSEASPVRLLVRLSPLAPPSPHHKRPSRRQWKGPFQGLGSWHPRRPCWSDEGSPPRCLPRGRTSSDSSSPAVFSGPQRQTCKALRPARTHHQRQPRPWLFGAPLTKCKGLLTHEKSSLKPVPSHVGRAP